MTTTTSNHQSGSIWGRTPERAQPPANSATAVHPAAVSGPPLPYGQGQPAPAWGAPPVPPTPPAPPRPATPQWGAYRPLGAVSHVRNAATAQVGRRLVGQGLLMIVIGVAITVGSIAAQLPVFIVSWGPVVYGIVRVAKGLKVLTVGAPTR